MSAEVAPYTLELIVIRGSLLRIFAEAEGNGVGFDGPEMNHLLKGETMPDTYLMLDSIDVEKNAASYSLGGFIEDSITIEGNEARALTTVAGEKVLIGFSHLRKPRSI